MLLSLFTVNPILGQLLNKQILEKDLLAVIILISSLKPNTQIFIVSLETENDYYNRQVIGKPGENRRKTNHIKKEKYAKN